MQHAFDPRVSCTQSMKDLCVHCGTTLDIGMCSNVSVLGRLATLHGMHADVQGSKHALSRCMGLKRYERRQLDTHQHIRRKRVTLRHRHDAVSHFVHRAKFCSTYANI